ncbi:MAG: hypothetical protein IH845_01895 [Nanoarchaeota archaeon]|nr:hypothetical protein [Nanoarchaeota archaeon]
MSLEELLKKRFENIDRRHLSKMKNEKAYVYATVQIAATHEAYLREAYDITEDSTKKLYDSASHLIIALRKMADYPIFIDSSKPEEVIEGHGPYKMHAVKLDGRQVVKTNVGEELIKEWEQFKETYLLSLEDN